MVVALVPTEIAALARAAARRCLGRRPVVVCPWTERAVRSSPLLPPNPGPGAIGPGNARAHRRFQLPARPTLADTRPMRYPGVRRCRPRALDGSDGERR